MWRHTVQTLEVNHLVLVFSVCFCKLIYNRKVSVVILRDNSSELDVLFVFVFNFRYKFIKLILMQEVQRLCS